MKDLKNCSQSILENKVREFLSTGKNKFYLHDITRAAGLPLHEVEDFFLPLLKENEIEGSLEVRCPKCSTEMGIYKKYPDIPEELHCENCGHSFQKSTDDLEIVLEVKSKFFRVPPKGRLNLVGRKLTSCELNGFLNDSLNEKNAIEKGKKFEYFFENFMAQQEGFTFVDKHCRSRVGEIDYFYRSQHSDHPLWRSYNYVFIECKNWRDKIPSKEISHFIVLLKRKNLFKCCGIYLTISALSPEANTDMEDARKTEKLLVFALEKTALPKLIEKGLKEYMEGVCDKIVSKS